MTSQAEYDAAFHAVKVKVYALIHDKVPQMFWAKASEVASDDLIRSFAQAAVDAAAKARDDARVKP